MLARELFDLAAPERMFIHVLDEGLSSMVNVRDLGGLPLVGGGATRQGVLLRSDAPYPGDRAPEDLAWPPSTVLDLRDVSESGAAEVQWPPGVRRIQNPVFANARMDRVLKTDLVDLYASMLATARPRIVTALEQLDMSGPTLVHCAAGKDRTGVVIAIALSLAGVEPEAIVADYQRTADVITGIYARLASRRRLPHDVTLEDPIFRTPCAAIDVVLGEIAAADGGVWGWYSASGGDVDRFAAWLDRFRDRQ